MIILINVFTVDPANQHRLLDLLARATRTLRPRDVRDVGAPHVDPNQCASVVEEELARRLFRLSGRPIGRPFLFRLSVALQHGPGRGGQLELPL